MKSIYIFCFLFLFGVRSFSQTLTSFSVDTFFQGEHYNAMVIYGNNILPVPNNYFVYGIYLRSQQNPLYSIPLVDSNEYPYPSASASCFQDSVYIYHSYHIPLQAIVGAYDLILIRCNTNSNPPTSFIYDTLLNATYIGPPDGYISGKTYIDYNYNKILDAGDSVVTFMHPWLDFYGRNISYDSSGNFIFPVKNGSHILGVAYEPEYVLYNDSTWYNLNFNSTNISNMNFGFVPGLVSCSPDTVHQGDTVSFDLRGNGIFLSSDFDYFGLIDSLGNQTSMINVGLFTDSTTYIDSTNIIEHMTVSVPPGSYTGRVVYGLSWRYFTLPYPIVVLPPLPVSSDDLQNNNAMLVMPNPANQYVKIAFPNDINDLKFSIIDCIGKIVSSGTVLTDQPITISQLSNGIYLIKVTQTNGLVKMVRFVKSN